MLTSDGEHAMMQTLHKKNIECPLPVLNIHGTEKSMEKLSGGISMFNISFCLVQGPGWPDRLCQVIAAYALRLNSRAGTEGSTVSSLNCDCWLTLGL